MHIPGRLWPAGAQNKQGVFAMRKRHSDSGADEAAIDLTPMLDIVFIMLIFHRHHLVRQGVRRGINRPSASTAETVKKGNIMVAVRENGQVWVDKRVVEWARCANIERLRAENPESAVVIQADTESRSGLVVQVMDQIRMAGVQNISIAGKQEQLMPERAHEIPDIVGGLLRGGVLPVPGNEQAHHAGSPGADGAGGRHHDRLHPPQASGDPCKRNNGNCPSRPPNARRPARDGGGEHGQAADGELPMDMPKPRHPGQHRWWQRPGCLQHRRRWWRHGWQQRRHPDGDLRAHDAPQVALAGLASGKVLVEFTVTERGTVSNIRIVKEEPRSYDLGKAARQTRQVDLQAGHGGRQAAGQSHAARDRVCDQLRKVAMKKLHTLIRPGGHGGAAQHRHLGRRTTRPV